MSIFFYFLKKVCVTHIRHTGSVAMTPERLFTSAEREVKDSRRSGMYQSCHFLTGLEMQSL